MLQTDHALVLIVVMLIFGFTNAFIGRDIFKPLLLIYGFVGGMLLVGAFADYTNTEASPVAVVVVGGIFAGMSYLVYYLGLAVMGGGAGILIITYIAQALGLEPAPLLLLAIAVLGGGLAVIFHDYIVIFSTALAGATVVAQALYLFFPDTQATFTFEEGLTFYSISTGALVIGAIITLIVAGLGIYVQYKSFEEHKHQAY